MLDTPSSLSSYSVVCISKDPQTECMYMLLGKENAKYRSGKWCSFGGHGYAAEDPCTAAAREFAEESCCTIMLNTDIQPSFDSYISTVCEILHNKEYIMRIETSETPSRIYFVIEVPFQPNVHERFSSTLNILKILYATGEACQVNEHLVMNRLFQLHPAITDGVRPGVLSVRKEYMEKQTVGYWSFDRLRDVVNSNGRHKNEYFVSKFLPVIRTILDAQTRGYASSAVGSRTDTERKTHRPHNTTGEDYKSNPTVY